MSLLIPLLLLAVMYMLLIRPQQQRVRRQRMLVSSLEVGDKIVTIGGIVGQIVALNDESADVEIAPGVTVTLLRAAVNRKYEEAGVPPVEDTNGADDEPEVGA
jgi:preprotein translocase subunit YajC